MDNTTDQTAPKKILCLEDEHFISELYSRALTNAGYDVTVVIDGEECLRQAATNTYDIILVDIMVPNLIGTEVLKRLRDPNQQPPLKAKIIVTTNLEQNQEARQMIEKIADGYLIKADVTPRQLVEFLQQLDV